MLEVPTLGDGALQAGVESIARKEGQQLRLALELVPILIILDQSHEAREASDGLGAGLVDMVDVVVVEDAQVGLPVPRTA